MIIAMCILLSAYVLMMAYMIVGWQKAIRQPQSKNHENLATPSLTTLIPFRNEEANLPKLLEDLSSMDGDVSALRIILIDDHSTDSTNDTVRPWLDSKLDVRLLSNNGEGKVAALNTGLLAADTDYVISLDADIRLGLGWYQAIRMQIVSGLDLCILPVLGTADRSLAGRYAQLDFMSLIGVTFAMAAQGRPVMANGAQLMIKKDQAHWQESIVSGDDVFALHHIKAEGGRIGYVLHTDLIARTDMPNAWNSVWSQRVRWASKAGGYEDRDTLVLGWIVLAVHVGLWVLFCWTLVQPAALSLFLTMLLSKFILDLAFLIPVMRWFDSGTRLFLFPIAFVINLIQYPLVFLAGRLSGFTWKGRNYGL